MGCCACCRLPCTASGEMVLHADHMVMPSPGKHMPVVIGRHGWPAVGLRCVVRPVVSRG